MNGLRLQDLPPVLPAEPGPFHASFIKAGATTGSGLPCSGGAGLPGAPSPHVCGAGFGECLSRSRARKRAGGGALAPAAPHSVPLIGIGGTNVAGSGQAQRRNGVPEGPRCPVPFTQDCKGTP